MIWRGVAPAISIAVCVAVLLPLLAVLGYPFHLARADILSALAGQRHPLTHYEPGSFLLPNIAMEVATLGLTAVFPPAIAGRVFMGFTLPAMPGGIARYGTVPAPVSRGAGFALFRIG